MSRSNRGTEVYNTDIPGDHLLNGRYSAGERDFIARWTGRYPTPTDVSSDSSLLRSEKDHLALYYVKLVGSVLKIAYKSGDPLPPAMKAWAASWGHNVSHRTARGLTRRGESASSGGGGAVTSGTNIPGVTTTAAPNAIGTRSQVTAPRFTGSGGHMRVQHREFFRDLATTSASGAFEVPTGGVINVNPALPALFSWLSRLAMLYEEYSFSFFRIIWEPVVATTSPGQIMIAAVKDPGDATPDTKGDFLQLQEAFSGPSWEPTMLDCRFSSKWLFTRMGDLASANSGNANSSFALADYDVGKIFMGFAGHNAVATMGSVFFEYDVSFRRPIINTNQIISSRSLGWAISSGVTRSTPFGTSQVKAGDLPVTVNAAGTTLTFGVTGRMLLTFRLVGTTFANVSPTITCTGCTQFTPVNAGYYVFKTSADAWVFSSTLTALYGAYIQVNNVGDTVLFDFTPSAATVTSVTFNISMHCLNGVT